MERTDGIGDPGAYLDALDATESSDDVVIASMLDFLIGKNAPNRLAAAVLPRLGDLRGMRGELILGLVEGIAHEELWDALANALVVQPDLAPDLSWMALEILEGTGRIEARSALVELREEISDLLNEDVALSDLASEIEGNPESIPASIEALNRIEPDIRSEIIAGLGRELASPSLIALLEGLASSDNDSTRAVSALALQTVRASHGSDATDETYPGTLLDRASPGILASMIGPLDGEGRATILLVVGHSARAVVARFECDVNLGIIGSNLEGPFPQNFAVVRWRDHAAELGAEASPDCPISARLLLSGAAWLSGDRLEANVRNALVVAFGERFEARPIFAREDSSVRNTELDRDHRSMALAVLARRSSWREDSELARDLANEMRIRDGGSDPDPVRDPGPFRVLFEGRILGRIELYRRMLLWSAMVWREAGESELSEAARTIAVGITDPQNAVPGYPFLEELMIRSLSEASRR